MGDCFREGLDLRKQTKSYNQVGYQNSEDPSEVVFLPFWEFQLKCLKISSWQQALPVDWREDRTTSHFLSTSQGILGGTLVLPSLPGAPFTFAPGAEDAAVGSSGDCSAFLCSEPFGQFMGRWEPI